ncbi:MAG: YidH family protein [Anaerolineae bacterium]
MDDADDNQGPDADSRARTYLANERTFLSWFRTALALVALGLAAAQFLARDIAPGLPLRRSLAVVFIAGGVFAALAGLRRYMRANRQVATGRYQPAGLSVVALTALLVLLAGLAIAFVLLLSAPASNAG